MQPGRFDIMGFDRTGGESFFRRTDFIVPPIVQYSETEVGKVRKNPFDTFTDPGEIVWIKTIPGHTDQTTGEWVPTTTTEKQIKGRIQDELTGKIHRTNLLEERQKNSGKQLLGGRVLRTQTTIGVGDRIRILEHDGTRTLWEVDGIKSKYPVFSKFFTITWSEYTLKMLKHH